MAFLSIYELAKKGVGPKAIILTNPDEVVIFGCSLAGIPVVTHCCDKNGNPVDPTKIIETGDDITIKGDEIIIKKK